MAITDSITTADAAQALLQKGQISQETYDMLINRHFDEPLIKAVQKAETGGEKNPDTAVSSKGAVGHMQIMPSTAGDIAKALRITNPDLTDRALNDILGATYLQDQLDKFGDRGIAAAAYNAGPGRVGGIVDKGASTVQDVLAGLPPENKETPNYVKKVLDFIGPAVAEAQAPDETPPSPMEQAIPPQEIPPTATPTTTAPTEGSPLISLPSLPTHGIAGAVLNPFGTFKEYMAGGAGASPPPSPPQQPIASAAPSPNPTADIAAMPPTPGTPPAAPEPTLQEAPLGDLVKDDSTAWDKFDAGNRLQQLGVQEAGAAEMSTAQQTADHLRKVAEDQDARAAKYAADVKAAQEQADAQSAKLNSMRDDYMGTPMDSDRFWKNSSTGTKVLAGIMAALAGIGQGLQARAGISAPNAALEVIKDAINRDIDEQKTNIAMKGRGVEMQSGLVADAYRKLGDLRLSADAAEHIALTRAATEAQKIAALSAGPKAAANVDVLVGGLLQAAGEKQQAFAKNAFETPLIQSQIRKGVATGTVSPSVLSKEDRERHVKGLGFAATKEDAADLKNAREKLNDSTELIDQIIETRRKKGAEVLEKDVIRDQKSRASALRINYKDMAKLGALNAQDYEMLDSLVPKDPTEFTASRVLPGAIVGEDPVISQLTELKKRMKSSFAKAVRSKLEEIDPSGELQVQELKTLKPK